MAEEEKDSIESAIEAALGEVSGIDDTSIDEPIEVSSNDDLSIDLSEETTEVSASSEELEPLTPPQSWDRESRERFSSWSREAQEQILKRQLDMDRDYTNKTKEVSRTAKQYESLERAIEPHRQRLALQGVSPDQVVHQALAIEQKLNSNPLDGIRWICSRYGIDPRQLMQGQAPVQQDPHIAALSKEVQALKQERMQQAQAQQAQTASMYSQEVAKFAQEHPYVDELREEMALFVGPIEKRNPNGNPQHILKEAYDIALSRSEPLRTRVEQERQLERAKEERQKALEKVKAAEEAASSVSGAPDSASLQNPVPKSLEDQIAWAFDRSTKH